MQILIEELDESVWVAALDKNKLEGLEVDPITEEIRAGSIYWARVIRIDTTLDAAFVLLDGENIGLLNSGDLRIEKNGKLCKGGDEPISKLLQAGDMVLVQAKEGKIETDNNGIEKKAPRVSMNITLSGRYLIHTPFEKDSRISQRIRDKAIRKNLSKMQEDMKDHKSCIIRSAAANTQTEMLIREHKILSEMWEQLDNHIKENASDEPQLIMLGPDAIQRTLSDLSDRQIKTIEVIVMEHFHAVEEWCELYAPDLMTKITPITLVTPNGSPEKMLVELLERLKESS
ncbi:MAG: ribonuclease E/G, partial [Bdellovibrionales bacterium]